MLDQKFLISEMCCVTIISSCGCNLKCEYCLINRATNEKSHQLQVNTMKALSDGSFLENIKNDLIKLEIPFSRITRLELWGQEPTLTLHLLTEHLEDWVKTFPNWRFLMFSTNGMEYPDRLLDFIKKLDNLTNNKMVFNLQFSYDGDTSTNEIRGANDEKIFNNISSIIQGLNTYHFQHIDLRLFVHGVLSLDMLRRLNNIEKILNYYNTMGKYMDDLFKQIINPRIGFDRTLDLGIETPVQASTEEGLLLGSFIKNSLAIPQELFYDYATSLIRKAIFVQPCSIVDLLVPFNVKSFDEFIDKVLTDSDAFDNMINSLEGFPFCGTNNGSLHIMYDGTIVTCQNYIFDRDIEYVKADNDFELEVKKSLIEKGFYINPLTASKQECQKFLYIFNELKHSSFPFILDHMMNMMFWMSKAGQIDRRYADDQKLLFKHALLLTTYNCCIYNNRIKSGSLYVRWDGFIRFMCNGFVNEIENELNYILRLKGEDDGNRLLGK